MDRKKMMNAVMVFALVHLILSALIGWRVYKGKTDKLLTPYVGKSSKLLVFCVVSVVVNLIILYLAYKCNNKESYNEEILEETV